MRFQNKYTFCLRKNGAELEAPLCFGLVFASGYMHNREKLGSTAFVKKNPKEVFGPLLMSAAQLLRDHSK